MNQNNWVVINYTLPREPSKVRVSLWRKLKKIGAVNIQQSMWILPLTDENLSLFHDIKNEIAQNSGKVFAMKSSVEEDGQKPLQFIIPSPKNYSFYYRYHPKRQILYIILKAT